MVSSSATIDVCPLQRSMGVLISLPVFSLTSCDDVELESPEQPAISPNESEASDDNPKNFLDSIMYSFQVDRGDLCFAYLKDTFRI